MDFGKGGFMGDKISSVKTKQKELFGHPIGLYVLFFTEMWERFSYYGMRAILVLYLVATAKEGGLGWTNAQALQLYGTYTMLVYLMSVPGGIIADRLLGQKKCVFFGGVLLVAGHSLLAYQAPWAFYTALALIILGVGMLKPNISTMVGGLYGSSDTRRDAAFTIFYMGINVGAFFASLIVGYVGERIGWHYGFALAGIGMALGQVVFVWGQKHLRHVGNIERATPTLGTPNALAAPKRPFTKYEKDRIKVLLISFLIVIVFWASYEQAGGFLNLYAEKFTNRYLFGWQVPASWFQSLNPIFILVFGGVIAAIWTWMGKRNKEPSAIFKMGLGTVIMGLGFVLMIGSALQKFSSSSGLSNMGWLVGAYWFHTIGELALSPVSLAYITKISPKRITSSMMGLYFAATGVANKFAAELGSLSGKLGALGVFILISCISIGFGLLLIFFTRPINRLAHEESLAEEMAAEERTIIIETEAEPVRASNL